MARTPEARQLSRAIRRKGIDLVGAHGQRIVKALVAQIDPLVIELMRNDIAIDDDHLILGSMMRWYDAKVGFAVGDMVLVTRLDDGDWLVHEVVTQDNLSGLLSAPEPPTPLRDSEPETTDVLD